MVGVEEDVEVGGLPGAQAGVHVQPGEEDVLPGAHREPAAAQVPLLGRCVVIRVEEPAHAAPVGEGAVDGEVRRDDPGIRVGRIAVGVSLLRGDGGEAVAGEVQCRGDRRSHRKGGGGAARKPIRREEPAAAGEARRKARLLPLLSSV